MRAAEAKHLRWCDVQTFDGPLSTRYEIVCGIVHISRMAAHADQQHVLLECLGIGQTANTMRSSSILDHRLDTIIWPSTPNISSPKELQTVSVLSQSSSFCFFRTRLQRDPPPALQPPRCKGKGGGVHSVLNSGVEQRSCAHTVLLLGALFYHL